MGTRLRPPSPGLVRKLGSGLDYGLDWTKSWTVDETRSGRGINAAVNIIVLSILKTGPRPGLASFPGSTLSACSVVVTMMMPLQA